jgi:REP-associated tyrosine transposase
MPNGVSWPDCPVLLFPVTPHHVTQRGNRRARAFFKEDDRALYKSLLSEAAQKAEAEIGCYGLMPYPVHMIIVPSDKEGLRRTLAEAHRRYTG